MRTAYTTSTSQVMAQALLRQGYDRGASVRHLWNSGTEQPSFGLAGGFVRQRERAQALVEQGLRFDPAGDQEKRDVGSASQNTFSTGAALGIKNGHKKGGSCITRLIGIPQSKKPEKSQILRP